MHKTSTLLFMAIGTALGAQTITTTGSFTFSPELLTIEAGTDITVTVGPGHTMTEVDEAVWNSNGTTPNGGFNFSSGNHVLSLPTPGTYYYVCQPHGSMGMKGRIIVETNTSVTENTDNGIFQLFPNPANTDITVTLDGSPGMVLRLLDMQGREVLQHRLVGNDRIGIAHLSKGNYTALLQNASGASVARRQLTITR